MPIGEFRQRFPISALSFAAVLACAFGFCICSRVNAVQDDDLGHIGFGPPPTAVQQPKLQQTKGHIPWQSKKAGGGQTEAYPLLSKKELETIRSLPHACQADLPGLDLQQHKRNKNVAIRLVSGETDLGAQRQPIRIDDQIRTASLPPPMSALPNPCLLYTSPSPRDRQKSRMPSSA